MGADDEKCPHCEGNGLIGYCEECDREWAEATECDACDSRLLEEECGMCDGTGLAD